MTPTEIQSKLSTAKLLLSEIAADVGEEHRFMESECPLAATESDHYDNSLLLFGQGSYEWNCGFCGCKFMA
jgi:hypothetical protein